MTTERAEDYLEAIDTIIGKKGYAQVKDISKILNVPKSWVYARTREKGPGAMPKVKVGKYCRFLLDDVMEWLKKHNKSE